MPLKQQPERYQQALMLCGGGHQYPMLLGRYQALFDSGYRPDLLVATCGGSIIGHLIRAIDDPQQRLDWLSSEAMYRFWLSQTAGPGNKLHRLLPALLRRKILKNSSNHPPDLESTWLFNFSAPFPTLPEPLANTPDILVIGTQLNYNHSGLKQTHSNAIFSEAVFCNERTASLVCANTEPSVSSPAVNAEWSKLQSAPSAMARLSKKIANDLVIYQDVPPLISAQISVADCYYYAPVTYRDKQFIGGLMDLFPIELAQRCAHQVIAEKKADFDTLLASPAIKHVFGFDPQQRLKQYHKTENVTWLDKSTLSNTAGIYKKLNWRTNSVQLKVDHYAEFKAKIFAQYQLGYNDSLSSLKTVIAKGAES